MCESKAQMKASIPSSQIYCVSKTAQKQKAFKNIQYVPAVVQQGVKDLALSVWWLWSLPWHGFGPWPGNFHILCDGQKIKTKQNIVFAKHSCSLLQSIPLYEYTILQSTTDGHLGSIFPVSISNGSAVNWFCQYWLLVPPEAYLGCGELFSITWNWTDDFLWVNIVTLFWVISYLFML